MKNILVTQRVIEAAEYVERRDALDQRWSQFLAEAGFVAIPVPNHLLSVKAMTGAIPVHGILLTGGGDLVGYGGDTPERDTVERYLLEYAMKGRLPLIGVCRGMQAIQNHFKVRLEAVEGHITPSQTIRVNGQPRTVNSFHKWGTRAAHPEMETVAVAEDGVVEAIRHKQFPLMGVMWHPERLQPFQKEDLQLFGRHFSEEI